MKNKNRLIALLLALCLAVFAACGSEPAENPVPPEPEAENPGIENLDPEAADRAEALKAKQKEMLEGMLSLQQENSDVMGWLYLNDTTIDEAVVKVSFADPENKYYLRRDAKGENNFYGCYFADWRCYKGGRDSLSKNTVIFGHSMSEDPEGVKFSQLKKYLDPEFAKTHPYLYFSTIEEDMVWQVFAVYYTDVDFNYIEPNPTKTDFKSLVDKARSLSFYDYDTEVGPDDKILTLSTCTYQLADGTKLGYPNKYRYVVMAKLLEKEAPLEKEVSLTVTSKAPKRDANVKPESHENLQQSAVDKTKPK